MPTDELTKRKLFSENIRDATIAAIRIVTAEEKLEEEEVIKRLLELSRADDYGAHLLLLWCRRPEIENVARELLEISSEREELEYCLPELARNLDTPTTLLKPLLRCANESKRWKSLVWRCLARRPDLPQDIQDELVQYANMTALRVISKLSTANAFVVLQRYRESIGPHDLALLTNTARKATLSEALVTTLVKEFEVDARNFSLNPSLKFSVNHLASVMVLFFKSEVTRTAAEYGSDMETLLQLSKEWDGSLKDLLCAAKELGPEPSTAL